MSVDFSHVCIIYFKIYEKMSSGGLEDSLSIFSLKQSRCGVCNNFIHFNSNIPISFGRINIIRYLFNRLIRNMTKRMISVFEMSIKKVIYMYFARLFHSMAVLSKSSFLFKKNLSLIKIVHATSLNFSGNQKMHFNMAYPHATELTFPTPVQVSYSLHLLLLWKFVTDILKMCTKKFNDEQF